MTKLQAAIKTSFDRAPLPTYLALNIVSFGVSYVVATRVSKFVTDQLIAEDM